MKITCEFLRKIKACEAGIDWFRARPDLDGADYVTVCAALEGDRLGGWSLWLRRAMVCNNTSPAVLERLSVDGDWAVREAVAGNRNTPLSVLATLAGDGDWFVRRAAKATIAAAETVSTISVSIPTYIFRPQAEQG